LGTARTGPYDWAISFETRVRELLLAGEYKPLVNYEDQLGSEAELGVPTPDHYLPLLYVAGTRTPSEPLTFPVHGVDGGSVSMLAEVGWQKLGNTLENNLLLVLIHSVIPFLKFCVGQKVYVGFCHDAASLVHRVNNSWIYSRIASSLQ
jgi:hypothetical protein